MIIIKVEPCNDSSETNRWQEISAGQESESCFSLYETLYRIENENHRGDHIVDSCDPSCSFLAMCLLLLLVELKNKNRPT